MGVAAEGLDVVLVKKAYICSGTTVHTTSKITVQHGLIYYKLIRSIGIDDSTQYYRANAKAMERLKKLCCNVGVPMEEKSSFVYSSSRQKLGEELTVLQKLGIPAIFEDSPPLPEPLVSPVKHSFIL